MFFWLSVCNRSSHGCSCRELSLSQVIIVKSYFHTRYYILHNTVCLVLILKCLFPQSTTAEHQRLSRAGVKLQMFMVNFFNSLPEENRGKENQFMFVDMFWSLGFRLFNVSGLKCGISQQNSFCCFCCLVRFSVAAAHSAVGFTALVLSPTALSVPGPVLSVPLSFTRIWWTSCIQVQSTSCWNQMIPQL